jgi:hypothetical protein
VPLHEKIDARPCGSAENKFANIAMSKLWLGRSVPNSVPAGLKAWTKSKPAACACFWMKVKASSRSWLPAVDSNENDILTPLQRQKPSPPFEQPCEVMILPTFDTL